MRLTTTIEGKYPIIEAQKWTQGRKEDLMNIIDTCEDDERREILQRLGMSDSEISAIKNDLNLAQIGERKRKTNDEIGFQVMGLIHKGNKKTDIGDIEGNFTAQEEEILRVLKLYGGDTVHKGILHKATEAENSLGSEEKIVDVLICKIRRKMTESCPYEIETVWGRGYRLIKK